jgi:Periplasmic binding protein
MVDRTGAWLGRTLAALVLTSCVAAGADVAWAADTIKVGFMAPMTGIFAQAGKDMLEGLKLAFEQIGYQTAGRKIELIEEDDEGNPAVAQAKYRKLVTQDHVHVLTGVLLSNIGYGLIPPIERDQFMTDEHVIRNLGDEAVGAIGALIWAPTLTTPANRTYMKLAEAKVGKTPATSPPSCTAPAGGSPRQRRS